MKSDSLPFVLTQIYIVAEVLAVPALPLTASSGYLFGLIPGFITVLVSATIAASISFLIGRTLLRDWAQSVASGLCYTFYSILLLEESSQMTLKTLALINLFAALYLLRRVKGVESH